MDKLCFFQRTKAELTFSIHELIDELIVEKEVLTRWREVLVEFGEKE